jgi:hypothetical protein
MKKLIVMILVLTGLTLNLENLHAQKEAWKWYFGKYAGLDFSTTPPTTLVDGELNGFEGCASISDSNGNLLFYTKGDTIWNRNHQIMLNGAGLLGHESTTQSSIIIKKPNSNFLYYVFTLDSQGGTNGLQYSIVDITLDSGNGAVVSKNNFLENNLEEKLGATFHKNGVDVWILVHQLNSNTFKAFLLTSSGISSTSPISTVTGLTHTYQPWGSLGQLKFSPTSEWVAACTPYYNCCELFQFNSATGILSNSVVLTTSLSNAYGCEFSSDGSKLYAVGLSDSVLLQWNLCAGNSSQIALSMDTIHKSVNVYYGSMQLGPDGKIYVSRYYLQDLGVINSPNSLGSACLYVDAGQSISPRECTGGLPNFNTAPLNSRTSLTISAFGTNSICIGESKTLQASGALSYTWNANQTGSIVQVYPTADSLFLVIGKLANGCAISDSINLYVLPCLFTQDVHIIMPFRFYPNPVSDEVTCVSEAFKSMTVTIKDVYGNAILIFELNDELILDLNHLSDGLYFFVTEDGVSRHSTKFIKVK